MFIKILKRVKILHTRNAHEGMNITYTLVFFQCRVLKGARNPKMPVFEAASRCFFQVLKLLVCRRRVAVADGGGAIIHSLAFSGISGNMLHLNNGGGGPARRMTFV